MINKSVGETLGEILMTVRAAATAVSRRGLADVIKEIAAEQRSRGFPGRSASELRADDCERMTEDIERDLKFDTARVPQ